MALFAKFNKLSALYTVGYEDKRGFMVTSKVQYYKLRKFIYNRFSAFVCFNNYDKKFNFDCMQ